jgi:hypothetical protein
MRRRKRSAIRAMSASCRRRGIFIEGAAAKSVPQIKKAAGLLQRPFREKLFGKKSSSPR